MLGWVRPIVLYYTLFYQISFFGAILDQLPKRCPVCHYITSKALEHRLIFSLSAHVSGFLLAIQLAQPLIRLEADFGGRFA